MGEGAASIKSKSSMSIKYLKPDRTGNQWYKGYLHSKAWKKKVKKLIEDYRLPTSSPKVFTIQ
jgi:hypothetical protein